MPKPDFSFTASAAQQLFMEQVELIQGLWRKALSVIKKWFQPKKKPSRKSTCAGPCGCSGQCSPCKCAQAESLSRIVKPKWTPVRRDASSPCKVRTRKTPRGER